MTIDELELEALGMPEDERVRLANSLIASLSGGEEMADLGPWEDAAALLAPSDPDELHVGDTTLRALSLELGSVDGAFDDLVIRDEAVEEVWPPAEDWCAIFDPADGRRR